MIEPIKILGVPVHPMTMQEAVTALEERMQADMQTFVVTANAEIIMMCQEDAGYNQIISHEAELVLPDGAGAVWAGRHLGYKVPERVAGFDLYNQLYFLGLIDIGLNLFKETYCNEQLVFYPGMKPFKKIITRRTTYAVPNNINIIVHPQKPLSFNAFRLAYFSYFVFSSRYS